MTGLPNSRTAQALVAFREGVVIAVLAAGRPDPMT